MKHFLAAVCLWVATAVAVAGQGRDIEATIGAQIEAFRADDFDRAFTYASPSIQSLFGTPENFGVMVRNGYPMVWRPVEVRFLALREIDGALWQMVQVTDAAGVVHILDYQMVQQESGWKINGVQILRRPGVAA